MISLSITIMISNKNHCNKMKKALFLILLYFPFNISAANDLDSYLLSKNKNSKVCSDEVFMRRTYITMTGRLPEAEKVVNFLKSNNIDKRDKLIDEVLNSEEYVHYMAMRWGDILRIKSEFPSNLWPNAVQAYNRWIYEKISKNTPYNQFVSELLLSKGSNFREPAVNFYRAFLKRSPENTYNNIILLFLGTRKPLDNGKVFFNQIRYKSTKEWKEEIVYIDIHQKSETTDIVLFDGSKLRLSNDYDNRITFVNWLTCIDNKRFAGVMVNRLWFWVTGKGIVNEPDDWGSHNPASNQKLLDFLTEQFISSGYDTKRILWLMLNSKAFQSEMAPSGIFVPQRLQSEVMVDALADITGHWDKYSSRVPEPFTNYPQGTRSIDLGDATVSSSELELFGRISRDVSLESQRSNNINSKQLLFLTNSAELENSLRTSKKLDQICTENTNIAEICNAIALITVSRFATLQEQNLYKDYAQKHKLNLRNMATEITWTYINSTEFLYNH